MKLSGLKVLELNKQYNLIENLCERENSNPEGIDLELRVGRVERIIGSSFLGVNDRSSPKTELIGDIETDGNKMITIQPGDYFLVRTMEKINCPKEPIIYTENEPARYIIPDIKPRVSLQKGGIILACSTTNPGYSGQLVFGLSNSSKYDFTFELGARMFKILWEPIIGDICRPYSGQHQGGRITSQGSLEKQN
jgi:deoxycytidine triphosphate deaminase